MRTSSKALCVFSHDSFKLFNAAWWTNCISYDPLIPFKYFLLFIENVCYTERQNAYFLYLCINHKYLWRRNTLQRIWTIEFSILSFKLFFFLFCWFRLGQVNWLSSLIVLHTLMAKGRIPIPFAFIFDWLFFYFALTDFKFNFPECLVL